MTTQVHAQFGWAFGITWLLVHTMGLSIDFIVWPMTDVLVGTFQWILLRVYGFFVADLLARLPPGELGGTTLILDRFNGASSAIRELRRNMRVKEVSGIRRIATRRSQSEVLIQLADMCAGATLREATTGQSFHAALKDRSLIWHFAAQNPPS